MQEHNVGDLVIDLHDTKQTGVIVQIVEAQGLEEKSYDVLWTTGITFTYRGEWIELMKRKLEKECNSHIELVTLFVVMESRS